MFWAAIVAGCICVALFHFSFRWLGKRSVHEIKRIGRWLILAIGIGGGLYLLRMGEYWITGALLFTTLALSFYEQVLRVIALRRNLNGGTGKTSTRMTEKEACDVLGVSEDATEDEIKAAYHALMQKLHPDHGGSEYLASQLNQAKEVLLKRRR